MSVLASWAVSAICLASVAGMGWTSVDSPLDAMDHCVVVETADGGLGTAFWVGRDRLVTAAHVVTGQELVWIRSGGPDGSRQRAAVVLADDGQDVAVLQPERTSEQVGLELNADPFLPGSDAYAIGSPIGELVLSQGSVLRVSEGLIESSTPVDPGSSGGPLVDGEGHVRGLVILMSEETSHAFAVPTRVLQEVLQQAAGHHAFTTTGQGSSAGQGVAGLEATGASVLAGIVVLALALGLVLVSRRAKPRRIVITAAELQQGPFTR